MSEALMTGPGVALEGRHHGLLCLGCRREVMGQISGSATGNSGLNVLGLEDAAEAAMGLPSL